MIRGFIYIFLLCFYSGLCFQNKKKRKSSNVKFARLVVMFLFLFSVCKEKENHQEIEPWGNREVSEGAGNLCLRFMWVGNSAD